MRIPSRGRQARATDGRAGGATSETDRWQSSGPSFDATTTTSARQPRQVRRCHGTGIDRGDEVAGGGVIAVGLDGDIAAGQRDADVRRVDGENSSTRDGPSIAAHRQPAGAQRGDHLVGEPVEPAAALAIGSALTSPAPAQAIAQHERHCAAGGEALSDLEPSDWIDNAWNRHRERRRRRHRCGQKAAAPASASGGSLVTTSVPQRLGEVLLLLLVQCSLVRARRTAVALPPTGVSPPSGTHYVVLSCSSGRPVGHRPDVLGPFVVLAWPPRARRSTVAALGGAVRLLQRRVTPAPPPPLCRWAANVKLS